MPELPEVETVRKSLLNHILNRKIISIDILYPNMIKTDINSFKPSLENAKVIDIQRIGKFLIFIFDNNKVLISHLRMEGKYYYYNENEKNSSHARIIFHLDNNEKMIYDDTRKFGKMYLIEKDKINDIPPLNELGKEPWDKELTINYLKDKYKNKKLPIKTILLDQSIIVGIGNIYADEILFLSKINPHKKCNELSNQELDNIIVNTKLILEEAIKKGGTTIKTYTSVDGVHGLFQKELLVHGKDNGICPICNTKIIKDKINGRGTYYCPNCQK